MSISTWRVPATRRLLVDTCDALGAIANFDVVRTEIGLASPSASPSAPDAERAPVEPNIAVCVLTFRQFDWPTKPKTNGSGPGDHRHHPACDLLDRA